MENTTVLHFEKYVKYKEFLEECKTKKYDSDTIRHLHRTVPKCLGGNNKKENLIKLSVEDHIIAHILLSQCFDENSYECVSNLRSARLLNKNKISNEQLLEIARTYIGELNPFYGKSHTEETKDKIRKSNMRRKGISYDDFYKDDSNAQKQVRSSSTKAVWDKRSSEEKKEIGNKISDKLKGNTPWNKGKGKQVSVNGLNFDSIKEACSYFNTSKFLLLKNFTVAFLE